MGSVVLSRLVDRFLPGHPLHPQERRPVRVVVGGALLGIAVAIPSVASSMVDGSPIATTVISAFAAGCVGLLGLTRRGASIAQLRRACLGLVGGFLVAVSLITEQLHLEQLKWFALLPLLASSLSEASTALGTRRRAMGALLTGSLLAVALGAFVVVANRAGLTAGVDAPWGAQTPAALAVQWLDEALFVASIAGLVAVHDLALGRAEAELRLLRSMLSVCAWCRRIHDHDDGWVSMDRYLAKHTPADLTHGICPDCERQAMAEFDGRS